MNIIHNPAFRPAAWRAYWRTLRTYWRHGHRSTLPVVATSQPMPRPAAARARARRQQWHHVTRA